MADLFHSHSRSARLDRVLSDLLGRSPELQAASVVSFDGLPMASALPVGMDEDRVAAMSAALLSLGERAAENFGRGALSQVYVEGENGTVFLVSAEDEAVLVAVGAKGAKIGLLMFEVRRSAASVADALRADDAAAAAEPVEPAYAEPVAAPEPVAELAPAQPLYAEVGSYPEPEDTPLAPALHVVEGLVDEPDDLSYDQPYEQPNDRPYLDEPAAAPTAWGTHAAVAEARQDQAHWTAYDQTGHDAAPEPGRWG